MYDLTITLSWEGLWVEDDNKQVFFQLYLYLSDFDSISELHDGHLVKCA